MTTDDPLKKEVLTRLRHAHPAGLGKEILDNFEGEYSVADTVERLQQAGLVQDGCIVVSPEGKRSLKYPIKLSSAGVEAAKALEG